MEQLIQILSHAEWTTILAVAGMFWVFNNHLNKKFDKIDQRFDKVDQRFDKMEEKITDIDRRLCRLEGAFTSKECCAITMDRHNQKAE